MKDNATLPTADNWDSYWSLDKTQRFTKISWSKRRMMRILSRYINKETVALDAGCGSGFFSNYFCENGCDVVAIDYAKEALEIAKQLTNNRIDTVQMDLLTERISDKTEKRFDIIFTDGLFEHFPFKDQKIILNNFLNVLNSDGLIVTFVPNKWSPWELIRPFYMPGIEEDPFTLKQLLELQQDSPLSIIESGGINTLPFALSPDRFVGHWWGMLLYTIAKKNLL